ncbi:MAG: UDP-N-acetylglucosamine 2-epimerase (non-hydrolyzing) [Ignavibacteria bacterium]|nr:UDP-N-acetylglucosamine 2-epimerase (non-hydrolyzing) [Ignavibacteria bacterium]
MKKIAIIYGTRPDTIKLAPVIKEFQKYPKEFQVISIATAQHRQMLDQVLEVFDLKPDYDLNIMKPKQSLATITKRTIEALDKILVKEQPDMVIVQGDTTTTFVGSLAAFYRRIPVAHVEAGLRTNDKANPFPEEINRRLTGCMTDLHLAPTATSKKALVKENIPASSIFITGNTVIDALNIAVKKKHQFARTELVDILKQKKKFVLLTMHRRENWGEPMRAACNAVARLARENPKINFVFPVHLNPIVREVVFSTLHGLSNVFLIEPLDYADFVNFLSRAHLIITDSGGVQEEGPHFGIPILVLRKVTERPEAVTYGTVKLTGMDEQKIYKTATQLLHDKDAYNKMATATNPYGDGKSSKRTVQLVRNYFGMANTPVEEFNP